MANRRELVKRRRATTNIRKITRTMQLIATARFQAAFNRAVAGRPYADKLAEMVADLARAARDIEHPLMATNEDAPARALVVLTSNRGLCGGYNAHVLRRALDFMAAESAADAALRVHMVGRKGASYFRFLGHELFETITSIGDKPRFAEVLPLANELIAGFTAGELATVDVAYMKFESAGRQEAVVERLLPLRGRSLEEAAGKTGEEQGTAGPGARREVQYEFSPSPLELLNTLLPATVRVRLFQFFNDAAVSEQVARMVAMKAATDAAEDMIRRLTLQYNRARQSAITMELLDIVGGASALE